MANNRMNLCCPCGASIVLARAGVGSPEWDAPRAQPVLTDWLREHEQCEHPRAFDFSAVGFTLEYEAEALPGPPQEGPSEPRSRV